MYFFKRRAPNDMKKEDLIAKWWIIADWQGTLTFRPHSRSALFDAQKPLNPVF